MNAPMNAVELVQKRIDEQTKKLDEDLTHVMFCHSGSKYDLTCSVPNCEYADVTIAGRKEKKNV